MTPALAATSLVQAALFALVGWLAGDWLVSSFHTRRERDSSPREAEGVLEWPERLLVGAAGFVVAAVAFMVANIVLGGLVFGVPGVVPVVAIGLVLLRRRRLLPIRSAPTARVVIFVILAGALWCAPALLSGTAARSGDIPWHLGWTEQLLAGEPVPEGPAPAEVAENAYPWGFHAVLATLVRLVPGSDVAAALIALQLVLTACIPLAAACLARRLVPAAGWAAAGATAFIGGFGWLLAREPAFVTSPGNARYGADLVVASPNAVYGLFPPPLPRELGLVLLAAAAVLLVVALVGPARGLFVPSGIFLGCAGLVSVPALVAGIAWTVAAVAVTQRGSRLGSSARVLLPAGIVFGLWAGPVVRGMLMEGGLVNVSPSLGREWPPWTALGSWGLLLPLIVVGVLAARRRPSAVAVGAFGAATVGLLVLAMARGAFDWPLAGNATVLHQGRIWPIAHLLAGAIAGVGLWRIAARAESWRRFGGRAVMAFCLVAGAASPALASVSLSRTMVAHKGGYAYGRSDLAEGSFVQRVADRLDPDDTLLVADDSPVGNALAFHLFSFSGVRLAAYEDPKLAGNDLRIRFDDLAATWDERVRNGGFAEDYVIERLPEDPGGGASPVGGLSGRFAGRSWVLSQADDTGARDP